MRSRVGSCRSDRLRWAGTKISFQALNEIFTALSDPASRTFARDLPSDDHRRRHRRRGGVILAPRRCIVVRLSYYDVFRKEVA
jgi:hypothetical protein